MEWDVGEKCNNIGGGHNIEKRTTKLERTTARSMCHVPCAIFKKLDQINKSQFIKSNLLPSLIFLHFSRIQKGFSRWLALSQDGFENTSALHVS
jgi:hypothetical protein